MFMKSYQGEIPSVSVIVGAEKEIPNLYSYFGKPKMNLDKKEEMKEEDANTIVNVEDDNDNDNEEKKEDMIDQACEDLVVYLHPRLRSMNYCRTKRYRTRNQEQSTITLYQCFDLFQKKGHLDPKSLWY